MAWIGKITNAGNALLSSLPSGAVCEITRAAGGSGTVDSILLVAQTALVSEEQEFETVQAEAGTGMTSVLLEMAAATTAFSMQQVGIWASADGGSDVLLAIFQNAIGIPVPNTTDAPEFLYSFYANLATGNDVTFSVSVDPAAYVSHAAMATALSEKAPASLTPKNLDDEYLASGAENVEGFMAIATASGTEYKTPDGTYSIDGYRVVATTNGAGRLVRKESVDGNLLFVQVTAISEPGGTPSLPFSIDTEEGIAYINNKQISLPEFSASDNGKVLKIVGGNPQWVTL